MSYSSPFERTQNIFWPSTSTNQFKKVQNCRKTNPGTKRSETPYDVKVSFYADRKASGPNVTGTVNSCSIWNVAQSIPGYVMLDQGGTRVRATNRSRQAFISKVREHQSASIGAAIGEFSQTLDMISTRLLQLYSAARAVRKGRFGKASSLLGGSPKWKPVSKKAAGAWLELQFGWVPVLSDIYQGMEVISSDIPIDGKVAAGGSSSVNLVNSRVIDGPYIRCTITGAVVSSVEIRGRAVLTNPNLNLLASLGLVNPLSVAWELVPWSFLVDHIVGIGDFLDSFSDEVGWNISDIGVSTQTRCQNGRDVYQYANQANVFIGTVSYRSFACYFARTVSASLPPYVLSFTNPFTGLSAKRAANYVALLLQQL